MLKPGTWCQNWDAGGGGGEDFLRGSLFIWSCFGCSCSIFRMVIGTRKPEMIAQFFMLCDQRAAHPPNRTSFKRSIKIAQEPIFEPPWVSWKNRWARGGIGWISRDFLENIKIKKFFLRFWEEIQAFSIILLANPSRILLIFIEIHRFLLIPIGSHPEMFKNAPFSRKIAKIPRIFEFFSLVSINRWSYLQIAAIPMARWTQMSH